MSPHVHINCAGLEEFCARYKIAKLSLFGSVLRADFVPGTSDIDVLIEFTGAGEQGLTYFKLARMQHELEALFDTSVDLVLASSLDKYLRETILQSAEVQYVAA